MQKRTLFMATALLAGTFAFGGISVSVAQTPTAAPTAGGAQMHHARRVNPEDTVETRIKTLHSKLKITNAQEPLWTSFAQTMRDGASATGELIKARQAGAGTMNALDDTKSYADIAQAHAESAKKLAAAFEPLYAAMSDDQKKNADLVFGNREGHGRAKSDAK
jgi:protein CpxP